MLDIVYRSDLGSQSFKISLYLAYFTRKLSITFTEQIKSFCSCLLCNVKFPLINFSFFRSVKQFLGLKSREKVSPFLKQCSPVIWYSFPWVVKPRINHSDAEQLVKISPFLGEGNSIVSKEAFITKKQYTHTSGQNANDFSETLLNLYFNPVTLLKSFQQNDGSSWLPVGKCGSCKFHGACQPIRRQRQRHLLRGHQLSGSVAVCLGWGGMSSIHACLEHTKAYTGICYMIALLLVSLKWALIKKWNKCNKDIWLQTYSSGSEFCVYWTSDWT